MRILIAEDDRLAAHVLETALRAQGYDVVTARDGLQAWSILQADDRPQLAILDWMMPGIDGLEVCRRVRRADGPYVYILLLTANTDSSAVVAGIDAGADDYIKKPFNPEELQARLRSGKRIVQLEEMLRLQATHDGLTGLMNRSAIMERLAKELERASRERTVVSVCMIDLDYFKKINDTHGHPAGDAVLRETAARMTTRLRPYDLLGRYGGEEFICVFPKCEPDQARMIAERFRIFIAAHPIDIGSQQITVTASIGIASSGGFGEPGSLVRAADAALFRAKEGGRNRVESAAGPPTSTEVSVPYPQDR